MSGSSTDLSRILSFGIILEGRIWLYAVLFENTIYKLIQSFHDYCKSPYNLCMMFYITIRHKVMKKFEVLELLQNTFSKDIIVMTCR